MAAVRTKYPGLDMDSIYDSMRQAEHLRDVGMVKALLHADDAAPGWSEVAFKFLQAYARRFEFFISEDVSDASKVWGLTQPPTLRAWGQVYRRAAKAGLIVVNGSGRSRLRHASICPRWQSKIFKGAS